MLKKHYKNPLFDIMNLSNYTIQNNSYTSVNKDKTTSYDFQTHLQQNKD